MYLNDVRKTSAVYAIAKKIMFDMQEYEFTNEEIEDVLDKVKEYFRHLPIDYSKGIAYGYPNKYPRGPRLSLED